MYHVMHLHAMDYIFLADEHQAGFIIQFSVECMCVCMGVVEWGCGGVGLWLFYSNQASVFLEGW